MSMRRHWSAPLCQRLESSAEIGGGAGEWLCYPNKHRHPCGFRIKILWLFRQNMNAAYCYVGYLYAATVSGICPWSLVVSGSAFKKGGTKLVCPALFAGAMCIATLP